MKVSANNTLAGLIEHFLDSVFYAHRDSYPKNMTRAQLEQHLDEYRDGMNEHNNCSFPFPAPRTVSKIYNLYKAELASLPAVC